MHVQASRETPMAVSASAFGDRQGQNCLRWQSQVVCFDGLFVFSKSLMGIAQIVPGGNLRMFVKILDVEIGGLLNATLFVETKGQLIQRGFIVGSSSMLSKTRTACFHFPMFSCSRATSMYTSSSLASANSRTIVATQFCSYFVMSQR